MKLVKETPSELVFSNSKTIQQWRNFLIIWIIFWLANPILAYVFSGKDTILCDRIEPTLVNCNVSQSRTRIKSLNTWIGKPPYTISGVREATLNERVIEDDDGGDRTVYQVALVTRDGNTHPVTSWGAASSIRPVAEEMNAMLSSTQSTWTIERHIGINWLQAIGGLMFSTLAIGGGIKVASTAADHKMLILNSLTLNKTTQCCTKSRKAFIGKNEETEQYPLSQLNVTLDEYEDDYNSTTRYDLKLLAKGSILFEERGYSPRKEEIQHLYTTLQNFLGLPPDSNPSKSPDGTDANSRQAKSSKS